MAESMKVTVTLDEDTQDFIRDKVEHGSFSSTSDYIETVIQQNKDCERARQRLDAELQKGLDDVRAGRVLPIDEAFAEIRQRLGITKSSR